MTGFVISFFFVHLFTHKEGQVTPVTLDAFDFKRRCIEWSVYDIKVLREPFKSIGFICSFIALTVL